MSSPGGNDGHVEVDAEIDLDRIEREFGPRLEAIVGRAVQAVDRQFTQLERNTVASSDRIARTIGDGYKRGAQQAVAAIRVLNQQKIEPKIDLNAAQFRRDLRDMHRAGQAFFRANPLTVRVDVDQTALSNLSTGDLTIRAEVDAAQVRRSVEVAHAAAQAWLTANPLKVDLDVDTDGFEERMARLTRNRRIRIDVDQTGGGGGGAGAGGGADGGSMGLASKIALLTPAAAAAGGAVGVLAGGLIAATPAFIALGGAIAVGMDGIKAAWESNAAPALDDMKTAVSSVFEQGMGPGMSRIGELMKAITPQMQQVAGAISGVFDGATKQLASMTPQLQTITASAGQLIQGLGPGIGQMIKGVVDMASAAAPFMQSIGEGIGSIFGQLGQVFTNFAQSGDQFNALMGSFQPMLEGLGAVLASVVEVFLNLGSVIGPMLGPIFDQLADTILALSPALEALGSLFGQILTAIMPLVTVLAGAFSQIVNGIVGALEPLIPAITQIITILSPVITQIATILGTAFASLAPAVAQIGQAFVTIAPVIGQVVTLIAQTLGELMKALGPIIADVMTALAPAFNSLMQAISPLIPIFGEVARILAEVFGQALIALAPVVTEVLKTVGEMFRELAPTITEIVRLLGDAFGQIIAALGPVLLDTIKALMPAFTAVAKAIGQVLQAITPLIPIGVQLVTQVISALAPILPQIATAFGNLVTALLPLLPPIIELAMKLLPLLAEFISGVVIPVLAWLIEKFVGLVQFLVGTVVPAIVGFVTDVIETFNDFIDAVKDVWHWTEDSFNKVVDFVKGLPGKISSAASGMWNSIREGFKDAINWIIRAWNSLEFKIPGFKVGPVGYDGFTLGMPDIPMLRDGGAVQQAVQGLVSGPGTSTSDSILAAISNTEFVVNGRSTAANLPALMAINAANGPVNWSRMLGVPGYAGGTTGGNVWGGVSLTSDDQRNGWDALRAQFPGLSLTSGTRTEQTEGHPDNHNAGLAIDISGSDADERAAAEWIAKTYPNSRELIHSEGFAHNIKDGKDVGDGVAFYGADQMAAHANHVHWAPPSGVVPGVSGESSYGGSSGGDSSGAGAGGSTGRGSGATSKFTSADAAKKGGLTPVWVENWPSGGLGGGSGSSYTGTTSTGTSSSTYSGAKPSTSTASSGQVRATYSADDAAKVKAGKPIATKTATMKPGTNEAPQKGLKGGDLIDFSNGLAYYRDGTATDGLNWFEIPSIVKPTTVPAATPPKPTAGGATAGAATIPLVQNADGTWTSTDPEWKKLIDRESGGDFKIVQKVKDANSGGNEASGGFQIAKGTWASYGGTKYAPTAGQATPQQQAEIAAKIFQANNGRDWGVGLAGRENAAALRAGLTTGGNSTTTTSATLPGSNTPSPTYAGVTPANPASATVPSSGTPGATPSLTTQQAGQQETNPLAQAAGFGAPSNKSWFESVGSDLPSQGLGWAGDAIKEVGGELFDLVGLGGLFGKGVDFGVNAGKAGLESAKKAASTGVQTAGAATGNPAASAATSAAWSMFSGPVTFQNTNPNDVSRRMGRVMGMAPSTVPNREV